MMMMMMPVCGRDVVVRNRFRLRDGNLALELGPECHLDLKLEWRELQSGFLRMSGCWLLGDLWECVCMYRACVVQL